MFRNTMCIIRLGLVGMAAALATMVAVASSASAYQTGYGAVQLVSVLEASAPACTGSDAVATITKAPPPEYPQLLLNEGLEGSSLVTFTMALDGSISNTAIADSSGNRFFDRAAVDAVKKARFAPATQNCSKIAGIYGVEVIFAQGGGPVWSAISPLGVGSGRPQVK